MAKSLRDDVSTFVDGAEQSDDITILVLRRE
jgi:serine phosphatase RsbU (regulator of sigma subunit)